MDMIFDTREFEAALQAAAERLLNASTLAHAAEAGAKVLSDAIVTNVITMDIVDTGSYRDSWEPVPGPASATEASADAQSEVNYGPTLEYGSKEAPDPSAPAKRQVIARPAVRNAFDSPDVHARILAAEAEALGG